MHLTLKDQPSEQLIHSGGNPAKLMRTQLMEYPSINNAASIPLTRLGYGISENLSDDNEAIFRANCSQIQLAFMLKLSLSEPRGIRGKIRLCLVKSSLAFLFVALLPEPHGK